VIGLEAGDWLTGRDFAPDELRNNFRGWPQSVQKANTEIPTTGRMRRRRIRRAFRSIHDERRRRHFGALLGAELAPQSLGLQVVSETARRYGAARIPKGSTVEDWPFGLEELEPYYDKVEYEVGVSGKAGNIGGQIDPRGNIFEGPRKREYPMPPLRALIHGANGSCCEEPRLARVSRPAAINSQVYDSRPACVYHGYCNRAAATSTPEFDGGQHHSQGAGHRPPQSRHAGPRHHDRRRRKERARDRGELREGRPRVFPAGGVVLLAGYTYENVRMLLLSKSSPIRTDWRTTAGRWADTTSPTIRIDPDGVVPFDLNNWYGLPAQGIAVDDWADDNFDHSGSISSVAAISGCIPTDGRSAPRT